MQVIGLPCHVIRNGRAASRLLAAKIPNIEATRRRDGVARWRGAIAAGLTAEQAAKAVGIPRATLYRWEKRPDPLSRRPHHPRGRRWTAELARAVEDLRNDNPMWGKRKIAVLLRREASRSHSRRLAASSLISWGAGPSLLRRSCAAGPPRSESASEPKSVTPAACPRGARPRPRANSCRSTRSS